jgi:hypothetical protein
VRCFQRTSLSLKGESDGNSFNPTGRVVDRLLQGAAAVAVATIVIGFNWGGWTLGNTAEKQVNYVEQASVVRVLAPICADKFQRSADANANLQALNKADPRKRDEIIQKAGWATFPGSEPESPGSRGLCQPA